MLPLFPSWSTMDNMTTVTQSDVERKLAEVANRLDEIEEERARLLRRKEFLVTAMSEFFGESVVQQGVSREPPPLATGANLHGDAGTDLDTEQMSALTVADAADVVLRDGSWMTARQLTEKLNEKGKICNYKAVRIALERNAGKRFERRTRGPVVEWRRLATATQSSLAAA